MMHPLWRLRWWRIGRVVDDEQTRVAAFVRDETRPNRDRRNLEVILYALGKSELPTVKSLEGQQHGNPTAECEQASSPG